MPRATRAYDPASLTDAAILRHGSRCGMTLGLRPLEARQPGPLLMRRAVALFLCFFDEEVHRTAAFTCGAHIDEARSVVEHLQIQRADWCNALFCRPLRYSSLA